MAISGFYVGLYGLSKVLSAMFSSPKKEVGKSRPPSTCSLFTCAWDAVSGTDATSVLWSWLEFSSWRICL